MVEEWVQVCLIQDGEEEVSREFLVKEACPLDGVMMPDNVQREEQQMDGRRVSRHRLLSSLVELGLRKVATSARPIRWSEMTHGTFPSSQGGNGSRRAFRAVRTTERLGGAEIVDNDDDMLRLITWTPCPNKTSLVDWNIGRRDALTRSECGGDVEEKVHMGRSGHVRASRLQPTSNVRR